MQLIGEIERDTMARMSAYIGIRGASNSNAMADVPAEKMDLYQRLWWQPVHTALRVPKTKWVVLRYPTPSMAQLARMSTEAFEDYYFDVCTADYAEMARRQEPLRELQAPLAAAGVAVHLIGGAHEAGELDAKRAIDQGTRLAAGL